MDDGFFKPLNEQVNRVNLLLSHASEDGLDPVKRHRFLMCAVYPAVAIAELMIQNPKRENAGEKEALEARLDEIVPYHRLLQNVRVHDFHRITVEPPQPGRVTFTSSGPFTLTARQGGSAVMAGVGPDRVLKTTKNSSIKQDRPLDIKDGLIWDDSQEKWIDLFDALVAYLEGIQPLIDEREP